MSSGTGMFSSSGTAEAPGAKLRSSRFAVAVIFLLHGLVFSTWVCRIPAAQNQLQLSNGALGLVLLATSAGSLLAMPATGWLVARYGSRGVIGWSSLTFCLALIPLAVARSALELAAALASFGAAAGAQNVAMNSHAVSVEEGYGRPLMSSFHALFSLGAVIGSAAGGVLAGQRVPMPVHFGAGAAVFALATLTVLPRLHPIPPQASGPALTLRIPREVIALGLLAFCILIGEGAMADWSAVYLESEAGSDAGRAALGYGAYSAAMVAGRFAGDRAAAAWGRRNLVRWGAVTGTAGVLLGLVVMSYPVVLAGFALTGLGLSVITPNVFGAAGRIRSLAPGVGLAAVTTAGYVGFLTGPPLIGGLAQLLGLRLALGLVVVCLAAGAALAGAIPAEPSKSATPVA